MVISLPPKTVVCDLSEQLIEGLTFVKATKVGRMWAYTWDDAENYALPGIVRDEVTLELIPMPNAVTDQGLWSIEGFVPKPADASKYRVCRGSIDELWLQPLEAIERKYMQSAYSNVGNCITYEPKPGLNIEFAVIDATVIGFAGAWTVENKYAEGGRYMGLVGDILIRNNGEYYPHIVQSFFKNYDVIK